MHYQSVSKTIWQLITEIGDYYLPAIQREFVWEPEQIEKLFDSLLRGYPVGTLLFWQVREPAIRGVQFYELVRVFDKRKPHNRKANLYEKDKCVGILDGQQRISSLLIGLKGSYTKKTPRKHWTNPDAFPEKKLYMDLLYQPNLEDPEDQYRVRFLKPADAVQNDSEYWFRAGEILTFKTRDELGDFRRGSCYKDNRVFENNLDKLFKTINEDRAIVYFDEERQDLDQVLEIFVRLNSAGIPLSYSDLLLSLATASWTEDARELIYRLVDDLNTNCGALFDFDKDFVLKTLLVFNGRDVRFKIRNFSVQAKLEDLWDDTEKYLKMSVRLLAGFGFSREVLRARNAAIPVAYYLYKRQMEARFVSSPKYAENRASIKLWLIRALLKDAFGGNSDTTLARIREAIDNAETAGEDSAGFPSRRIDTMLELGDFTAEEVESFVSEASYASPDAFLLLFLLYPNLDYESSQFHMDHMHPASSFTVSSLGAVGMDTDQTRWALEHFNCLPNLQLLEGRQNQSKLQTPFKLWLASQKDPQLTKNRNFVPENSLELKDFREFYEGRRLLLVGQLKRTLGVKPG